MKIRLLLVTCIIAVTSVCFAQNIVTQDSLQTTGKNLENAKKTVIPSGRIILADMKANNPALFTQYQNGKNQQRKGMILTCVGGGLIGGSAFAFILSDITTNYPVLDGTVYYDSATWLISVSKKTLPFSVFLFFIIKIKESIFARISFFA